MYFLCRWTGGDMQGKGKKITKHPLRVPFSWLRIFRLFTFTENNVPSVINTGNNPTDVLTLSLSLCITWYSRLINLNMYLKMQ